MTEKMVQVADCRWEVTLDMIMRKAQFKGSARTLQRVFYKHKMHFRPFREKLALTPEAVVLCMLGSGWSGCGFTPGVC